MWAGPTSAEIRVPCSRPRSRWARGWYRLVALAMAGEYSRIHAVFKAIGVEYGSVGSGPIQVSAGDRAQHLGLGCLRRPRHAGGMFALG